RAAIGADEQVRMGPYAQVIVDELFGRNFIAALRNRAFRSMVKAITVAATHNTPIAAATATPVLGIHNPAGNNKAALLTRVATSSVSGTPAGGQFVLNGLQTTTAPTTPGGSIFNSQLQATASPQGSTMRPFNNVALTGMLPVVGNEIDLLGGSTAIAVGT